MTLVSRRGEIELDMKRFRITAYDGKFSHDIDETKFNALRSAKSAIVEAMSAEEKFDVLMENYVELETSIFGIAMDYLAFTRTSPFGPIRRLASRRLMNFLSSSRLYRDSIIGNVRRITRQPSDEALLRSLIDDSSSLPIEYRIMEAVRNFAQHRDLIVSGFSLTSDWEGGKGPGTRAAYTALPSINTEPIAQARGTPNEVASALLARGPSVHIMPLMRKSLEHYGAIHQAFRNAIKVRIEESSGLIKTEIADCSASGGKSARFLIARSEVNGQPAGTFQLFCELLSDLSAIQAKNLSQANISRRYVKWADDTSK